jgi:hypothetical protein
MNNMDAMATFGATGLPVLFRTILSAENRDDGWDENKTEYGGSISRSAVPKGRRKKHGQARGTRPTAPAAASA